MAPRDIRKNSLYSGRIIWLQQQWLGSHELVFRARGDGRKSDLFIELKELLN